MDKMQKALLMLQEVNDALARGTKHYNKHGVLLKTPKEIVEALIEDGEILLFQPLKH